MRRIFFPWRVIIAVVRWGFCADYVVKFASPSCVRFISFGFLLATACVWVWMVCSLHSVATGSRDRANVPLMKGGLSLFDESATLHEAFTKPSRGLREAFAERVFEKASRNFQGASTNPSRRFANPSRRMHIPKAPRRRLGGFTRPPRRDRG